MRFICGEELIYDSKSKSEDYHVDMNSINYNNWFAEKHISNILLSSRSTVVIEILLQLPPYQLTNH
jgi:hypothetical protein